MIDEKEKNFEIAKLLVKRAINLNMDKQIERRFSTFKKQPFKSALTRSVWPTLSKETTRPKAIGEK